MQHRLLAIACLASALALSQHANATAPPTEVSLRAEHKEVAMQPKDTVRYESNTDATALPFQESRFLVHRDTVATFPTDASTDHRAFAHVAKEVDVYKDAAS